jgi:lipopolysaccharide export system protein LptA
MNSELPTAASTSPAARVQTYVSRRGRRRFFSGLLLFALALCTVAVIIAYRSRPRPRGTPESVEPLPENARQSAAGYTFTRSEGGHPVFTIRAQRSVDLKSGNTLLEGVEAEVFGRAGDRHDLLQTQRCEYKAQSGDFFCAGRVAIEVDAPPGSTVPQTPPSSLVAGASRGREPIYLETSALSYNQQKSLATTAARVEWHYRAGSGSAVGLAYDTRDGWLELEHNVAATLPISASLQRSGAQSEADLHLAGAQLRYTKGQIQLAGPLQISQGERQVQAGHAIAYLDARNRITHALFDGGARALDPSQNSFLTAEASTMQAEFDPATGDLNEIQADGNVRIESRRDTGSGSTRLEADRVQTSFVGSHFHPAHGTASGNVRLSSDATRRSPQNGVPKGESQGSLSSEDLRASEMEFAFRRADGTLEEAHTDGPGKLLLVPSSSKAGNREITAGKFEMAFDARSRLESLQGSAPTRIVFEPAPAASRSSPPPESRAQNLQALLDPDTGALKSIEQFREFEFLDGDERASADRAQFSGDSQVLTLTGKPQLTDPEDRMQADRVVMHLATNTAEGIGHVSSIRWGGGKNDAAAKGHESASAGLNPPSTNVLADRVTADRSQSLLHYEGHVRAWRGADVVESPVIDIYRAERRIVAGSPVLTSNLAPALRPPSPGTARSGSVKADAPAAGRANAGGPGALEPAVIRADRLEYFDAEHRAAYRGHVRMDASGATLTADGMDAYFTEQASGASTLDHVVADGKVTVVEPGRRAAGRHAEYDAVAGKLVLTGGPPTLYDSEKGFVTGQILTFFTEGDSLLVGGGDGFRTLSKHQSTK